MSNAEAYSHEEQEKENAMIEVKLDTAVLELLASRICHDLISPVGAVNNGVEFLQEMGADAGEEAVSLIAYSAEQAAAKLQAFRMAYGAGGRDPNIKLEDVHKTFSELLGKDSRTSLEWDPYTPLHDGDEMPGALCKVLIGTLILTQESLPKGGIVKVVKGEDGAVVISGEGVDAAPRPNAPQALDRTLPVADLDPRLVHAYALSAIAAQYGFTIEAGGGDNVVTFTVKTA